MSVKKFIKVALPSVGLKKEKRLVLKDTVTDIV